MPSSRYIRGLYIKVFCPVFCGREIELCSRLLQTRQMKNPRTVHSPGCMDFHIFAKVRDKFQVKRVTLLLHLLVRGKKASPCFDKCVLICQLIALDGNRGNRLHWRTSRLGVTAQYQLAVSIYPSHDMCLQLWNSLKIFLVCANHPLLRLQIELAECNCRRSRWRRIAF